MSTARFEIRGWHVLAAMLAFFGAIIAVNVTFAVYAIQSFPGEDVRRSYLQGVQYNDTLAERRAQAALGWQASTALRRDADGAFVEVTLTARDGTAIGGADITGSLQWPTSSQHDHELSFEPVGGGRYIARLGELQPGRWRLRARADGEGGALDFESELTWQPSR
jgi:nitrogen fixation protein FixH